MARPHLLDLHITGDWPDLSTPEAVLRFESMPLSARLAAQSTWEALQMGASANPDAPAIRFLPSANPDDTPLDISHAQFRARCTQAANAFHTLGVGPRDVVSFLLPLLPQAFCTLFGAQAAGIANPVNPLLETHQLVEILRAAGTKVLVALGPVPGSDIWDKVLRIRDALPALQAILVVGGASVVTSEPISTGVAPIVDFDALLDLQRADALMSGRAIAPTDTAVFFHTGGTTGTPKLVPHTHASQVYQAWAVGLMLRNRPGDALLFGLPLFHVSGALSQGLSSLASGGHLVVLSPSGWRNPVAQREVWRLAARYRPSNFSSVPTVLAAALQIPSDGLDLSSITCASGGGSAIPVPIAHAYGERFGWPVLEVYGMTETASIHTISYPERPVRTGSVGHAMPYSRVRVLKADADGRLTVECDTDEIGVVAMAGPGVFSGYVGMHADAAFTEPGWVNSGDLGRIDAEGYLWITGRAKDLVIRGGHNIDPQPIEDILYTHPAVGLAAMVGQPDAYAGELPVAYVQLKPGASAQPSELIAYVRERTPERAAVPVAIHIVEAIPLTGVGKVFKPALREDATQRVATALLADLGVERLSVTVGADPAHGSMITVTVDHGTGEALRKQIAARLDPLPLRHRVAWE